jgi:DNA-binding response OmpR family regulator
VFVIVPATSEPALVTALDLGADGGTGSEASPELIAAQGDALVRRFRGAELAAGPRLVRLRDLTIDFDRRRVMRGAEALELTRSEFDILGMLARNPGRVVSASEILEATGQQAHSEAQARLIVKVHISHLRQKLEAATSQRYLQTIRGVGYLLERRESRRDRALEDVTDDSSSSPG